MNKIKSNANGQKIGVFIAESYPVFRHGLESYIAMIPDMMAMGQAGTGQEMMASFASGRANVLLLDAGLSGLEGFGLLKQLKEADPQLSVLLMATGQDIKWLLRGIRAGAMGVVSRAAPFDAIEIAIRRVYAGYPYIPETLAEQLILYHQRNENSPLGERLSPRELEVMQELTCGLKLSEIARKLGVSHQTVTTHRRHILEKLALRTTAEIIRYGIQNGIGEIESTTLN